MTTYVTENENLKDEIKDIGVLLYVCTGMTLILAFILDNPYMIVDIVLIGFLAFLVHKKQSKKALYGATVYYLIDTLLGFIVLVSSPVGLIVRGYVLYALISTSYKAFKVKDTNRLIPATK